MVRGDKRNDVGDAGDVGKIRGDVETDCSGAMPTPSSGGKL